MKPKQIQACGGVVLTGLMMVLCCSCGGAGTGGGQKSEPPTYPKADAATQAERLKTIQDLQARGVFGKIDSTGGQPELWVRPAFYLLTFDEKQKAASWVYLYVFELGDGAIKEMKDRDFGTLRLIDDQTGKSIGHLDVGGLQLD